MVYLQEFLLRFDTVAEFFQLRYVKFYILRFYLCAHEGIKVFAVDRDFVASWIQSTSSHFVHVGQN